MQLIRMLISGVALACLLILLTACASKPPITKPEIVEIPVPVYIRLPDELTRPIQPPQLPRGELTNEHLVDYIEQLRTALSGAISDREKVRDLTSQ